MKQKPLILLVNDDGFFSPGLRFLINVCKKIARVYVVAPDKEQSGRSHAITVDNKIILKEIKNSEIYSEFSCSGTPVDCVKLAVKKLGNKKPDLCISGINHGSNFSISTLYSATVHAAIEGTIQGIPSLAISHLNYSNKIDMSSYEEFLDLLIKYLLKKNLEKGVTLNINLPDISYDNVKGVKVCRQGKGIWIEKINPTNKDNEFFITGHFEPQEEKNDTDIWALSNSFISIVPIKNDMTDYDYMKKKQTIEYDFQKR